MRGPSSASCSFIHSFDKEPWGSGRAGCCRGRENALVLRLFRVQVACLHPAPLAGSLKGPCAAPPTSLHEHRAFWEEIRWLSNEPCSPQSPSSLGAGLHPCMPTTLTPACPPHACGAHVCWGQGRAPSSLHLHPPMASQTLTSLPEPRHTPDPCKEAPDGKTSLENLGSGTNSTEERRGECAAPMSPRNKPATPAPTTISH